MSEHTIHMKHQNVPLTIQPGCLQNPFRWLNPAKRYVLITDSQIPSIHYDAFIKQGSIDHTIELPAGEGIKSIAFYEQVIQELLDHQIKKDHILLAFGGGVIGDFVGFVASTYLRGVSYIQIPTTLLAMIDSSIGGKVALDVGLVKNCIGQIYHPIHILIDPLVLETLPLNQLANGYSEMIKIAAIQDASLLQTLEEYTFSIPAIDLIEQAILLKKQLVEVDEFDQGVRQLLNFGHTIGHAIESYYQYQKYLHGEAVAIGMVRITTDPVLNNRLTSILKKYNLPTDDPVSTKDLLPFMAKDKKNTTTHKTIIVLEQIGQAKRQTIQSFEEE